MSRAMVRRTSVLVAAASTVAAVSLALPSGAVASGNPDSISPLHANNTSTSVPATVTIGSASHYVTGTTNVYLNGPAGDSFAGSSPTVNGTTIATTFDFEPAGLPPAAPGLYTLVICSNVPMDTSCTDGTATQVDSNPAAFDMLSTGGAPQVSSISPVTRAQGTSTKSFTITGQNFAVGDTLSSDNANITFSDTKVVSATEIQATLNVGSTAALGQHQVTVTDTQNDASTPLSPAPLTVDAAPSLAQTVVAVGKGATSFAYHESGASNVQSNATAAVLDSTGTPLAGVRATVTGISGTSPNQTVDLSFTVAPTANAGTTPDSLVVTDPTDGGSASQPFTLDAAPAPTSLSPTTVGQGASALAVTLTGSNLPASPTLDFGNGVTATSASGSATSTAATIDVSGSAQVGAHTVTVTNPADGGKGSCSCLTVSAAPVIQSISPAFVGIGTSSPQNETITGTGFQSGVSFTAAGVTFATQSVSGDGKTAYATVYVNNGAAAQSEKVTATNTDAGTWTCPQNCFTVSSFTISSISPDRVDNGSTVNATVTGPNIPDAATHLTLTNQSVTGQAPIAVNGTIVSSSSRWTGSIAVPADAAPGHYTVTLSDGSGSTGSCTCTFDVYASAPPTITGVDRSSLAQGVTHTVTITGTHFTPGTTVTFGATGVTAGATDFVDSTTLTVLVTTAANAATGPGSVTVIVPPNPDGSTNTVTCGSCLTVDPAPTVTGVSPAALAQGVSRTLTLTGTGFESGAGVGFPVGSGVSTTGPVTVTSATSATVPVAVAGNAPTTNGVTLTLTNPDYGSATGSLGVDAPPTLTLASTPYGTYLTAGDEPVTLDGSGFATGVSVGFSDPNVTASSVTPSGDGKSLTMTVTVPDGTQPESLDVTVTNQDGGTVTHQALLTVANPPAAPTNLTAQPGDGQVTLMWGAPTADNGAPVDGYAVTYTTANGTPTTVAATSPFVIDGLTNGTQYSFAVMAHNAVGYGDEADTTATPHSMPTITGASTPYGTYLTPGASQAVTLTGSKLLSGVSVTFSDPNVTASSVTPASDGNSLTMTVTVPGGTAPEALDVTVTNTDGGTATKPALLGVALPPGAPTVHAVAGDHQVSLSWTTPSSNGAPVSGTYELTYGPSGSASTTTVAVTGTATTVTGLTNGTTYVFSLVASNAMGSGPAGQVSAEPMAPIVSTTLVIHAAAHLTYGQYETVTATLSDVHGALAGQRVDLYARPYGSGTWGPPLAATTNSSGVAAWSNLHPNQNYQYEAVFYGNPNTDPRLGASHSSAVVTGVGAKITDHLQYSSVGVNHSDDLSGVVYPNLKGELVYLQQYYSGAWHNLTRVTLSSSSTYSFLITPRATGTYTFRIVHFADAHYITSATGAVVVKAT